MTPISSGTGPGWMKDKVKEKRNSLGSEGSTKLAPFGVGESGISGGRGRDIGGISLPSFSRGGSPVMGHEHGYGMGMEVDGTA
jgi:hypothetical protein